MTVGKKEHGAFSEVQAYLKSTKKVRSRPRRVVDSIQTQKFSKAREFGSNYASSWGGYSAESGLLLFVPSMKEVSC